MLSIIIPANNEERFIGACLTSLFESINVPKCIQLIIVANGCEDSTVKIAEKFEASARKRNWKMIVLDFKESGKSFALNEGDRAAIWRDRLYMDADVLVNPQLLEQVCHMLSTPKPVYVSGQLVVAPAKSFVTREYSRVWGKLPFMRIGVPGAGFYAVNAAGRRRWTYFPTIISDDTFVRLNFSPKERVAVDASYLWPLAEGWRNLIRVRRRQDKGVAEIVQKYPELTENDDNTSLRPRDILGIACRNPVGFGIYVLIGLSVRLSNLAAGEASWERGR